MKKVLICALSFACFYSSIQAAPNEATPGEEAPELVGITGWINSQPLVLSELQGQVILLDFWSYSCINCLRTLPYLNRWYEEYKNSGFLVIGIHSPEFEFEHDETNVRDAVKRYLIRYPVALDTHYDTWRAYKIHYWPTSILIDRTGEIRYRHVGEGNYVEIENAIRSLLSLAPLEHKANPPPRRVTTNEIYLGTNRAKNYAPSLHLKPDTISSFSTKTPPGNDQVVIEGLWRISNESITSAGSKCNIIVNFLGGKVHMVLSGASEDPITCLLDGKPVPEKYYSEDMDADGQIFMDGERMYNILDLHGQMGRHTLTIHLPPGISAYSFTFGD